ncbi:MAG: DNA translocase FtsK 4TM domain-containing protein [Pyrinomonadaceae bacterium]|nr:DNA translocase FtsK 4TM domain-containing protein [Pyrinomonadaceae bacterium]
MAIELEKKADSKSQSRSNEIVAVVLSALSVLFFLCLITFSQDDWSRNSTGWSFKVNNNWVGMVGAIIADWMFQFIGLVIYIIPVLFALAAWRVFQSIKLNPPLSQVLGYLFLIASTSGLLKLFGFYGGIVGKFLGETVLESLIGKIGAKIVLVTIFLISLLVITNLSFAAFFGNFSLAWENFQMRLGEWFSGYREWRDARNKTKEARLEKRRETRPEKPNQKAPTISTGDAFAGNPKEIKKEAAKENEKEVAREKTTSVGEKLSSIFKKLGSAAKPEPSETPAKIKETIKNIEEPLPPPIISVSEEFLKSDDESQIPIFASRSDEPITFTPVQPTGELDAEILEAAETIDEATENLPALPRKPQNFDDYVLPTTDFLNPPPPRVQVREDEARAQAKDLEEKTKEFNATGRVVNICPGPVVTTYEFKPDPGVKYSRITNLSDDLCLALEAESIRIDRIPGKAFVGIEVPNSERDTIHLREVIESKKFENSKSLLTLALGKTIDGLNYAADLAKMPHLLIAGATGAGKSVGVNTLVVSILYKAKPDEVKFIMVDPKQVELGIYADIPHLATPIITDPKRAANSLKWAVSLMEKRYKDLAGWGVRNIDGYNAEVEKRNAVEQLDDNGEAWKKLPYIVIIIDELADLMMVAGKEVEESITRLAQMARAVGIHLVLATQRPSVDVITGLIKANFPSRISFRVSSKVDSRTIIDANGAESLLGKGDMLFLPPGTSQIIRVHGAFVDEKEIAKIVEHIKTQGKPEYDTTITKTEDELVDVDDMPGRRDPLFPDALRTVVMNKSASTSLLQRHLRIGYGRAAAILDAMVREGYIGDMDGSKRARPIMQKAFDDLQEAAEGREL